MNYDLIIILAFMTLWICMGWMMSYRRLFALTRCVTSVMKVLPVSKIVESITNYYGKKSESDIKNKGNKKIPPRRD